MEGNGIRVRSAEHKCLRKPTIQIADRTFLCTWNPWSGGKNTVMWPRVPIVRSQYNKRANTECDLVVMARHFGKGTSCQTPTYGPPCYSSVAANLRSSLVRHSGARSPSLSWDARHATVRCTICFPSSREARSATLFPFVPRIQTKTLHVSAKFAPHDIGTPKRGFLEADIAHLWDQHEIYRA